MAKSIYIVVSHGGAILSGHWTYAGAWKACQNKPHLTIQILNIQE